MSRAWLGVVSREHVRRGVAGGFAQVCHGKAAPLKRMRRGDTLIYYSPSEVMNGAPLKAFTAIGEVSDDTVFEFDMGDGFVPYRRRVHYHSAAEVPLETVRDELNLCQPANWGIALRRGLLSLTDQDLHTIAREMGVSLNTQP
jgi:hypothetical protein